MSETSKRPNFFLLLGLDPTTTWDPALFEQALRQKRVEWSRQSAGVGRKALMAQQNLALLNQMQEIMGNPARRLQEAQDARAELSTNRQIELTHFEKQLALLNAKETISEQERERFFADFGHLFSREDIDSRLQVSIESTASREENAPLGLDPSLLRSAEERLRFLGIRSLYELLSCPHESDTAQLARNAEQLYRRLVMLSPSAEVTAKIELAGMAREIFQSDAHRTGYDESLRLASLDLLLSDLDESMQRSPAKELHLKQVQFFLRQAEAASWSEEEALARLKEHARQRRWIMTLPAVLPASPANKMLAEISEPRPQIFGNAIRLRWSWPQGCEEVLLSYTEQRWPLHHDPGARTRSCSRAEYEQQGYCEIQGCQRECYVLISTVFQQDEQRLLSAGTRLHVSLTGQRVITYTIKISGLWQKKRALTLAIDPPLPQGEQVPGLLLISRQGRLPFNRLDGEPFYRIQAKNCENGQRVQIPLPLSKLAKDSFGKLFLEDETLYSEYIIHHPGEELMRLE